MWYAQKSYSEKVGNGPFTLAQIGCFVTAFCNLLQKYGESVDPNVLNIFFTEHNAYLADPLDGLGVKDDLTWGSIASYDPTVSPIAFGSGWPSSDNSIVEFRYRSNGKEITHFCAVNSIATKTIIDSWDGQIKNPGVYGEPVAYATYNRNVPQPVPVPHPASQVVVTAPNYDGDSITIQPGWGLSNAAQAAGYPDAGSVARWEAIAALNGSNNWQSFNDSLKAGQRIKVGKYQVAPPSNQPAVQPQPSGYKLVTVQKGWGLERVAAAAGRTDAAMPECWQAIAVENGNNNWQDFNRHLQPGQVVKVPPQGGHGEGETTTSLPLTSFDVVAALSTFNTTKAGTYRAYQSIDVMDLSNPNAEKKPLAVGQDVSIAGIFSYQGTTYGLPQFAKRENSWYAIPMSVFKPDKKGFFGSLAYMAGSLSASLHKSKIKKIQA